ETYGNTPKACLDLLEAVDSHRLRLAWDPGNFVRAGVAPHTDGYRMLRPYLEYVQIKDARANDGVVVPAGQGDGQIPETIQSLREDNFEGFFCLEPHLESHSTSADVSGVELFGIAWKAFTDIL